MQVSLELSSERFFIGRRLSDDRAGLVEHDYLAVLSSGHHKFHWYFLDGCLV